MRFFNLTLLGALFCSVALGETPESAVRRFALAYMPYAPASSVDIKVDATRTTAQGQYQVLTALRTSLRGGDAEQLSLLVDSQSRQVTVGLLMPLPPTNPPLNAATLPAFVETVLPQMLSGYMGTTVRLRWPALPTRPTAIVPLVAEIPNGYGRTRIPAAITVDGGYFMLGSSWPLDRDPRAVRRELLRDAPIRWDETHRDAVIKLVEFSDFQCPACKRAWSTLKEVLAKAGKDVQHGMVNYPLTNSHPWAFAAAAAGECVGKIWPDRFLPFKEEFYRLQDTVSTETVKTVAQGFLSQNSLPEKSFTSCFMQDPIVDFVLRQIDLAQRMGVGGTPTYFANGEVLSIGNREWMEKRLRAIIAAKGLPENAAEIKVDPTPVPTATGASPTAGRVFVGPTPAPKKR